MKQEYKMKTLAKIVLVASAFFLATTSAAQDDRKSASEELKIAAIEALIAAPKERALPLVLKVLDGNHSDEMKERALFILSQIDDEQAQTTLLRFAAESSGELQEEAIRMIGIGGNSESLSNLKAVYAAGDRNARDAVLEAFMIAGDKESVFEIALTAEGHDFEEAVDMLGVMGARDELREIRSRNGASEAIIQAYAISGDLEGLKQMALDGSDQEHQVQAIEAMGIVGGNEVNTTLVQIYRDAASDDIREAALDGMLISGHDEGVLELYRSSDDPRAKKELLEQLVIMGSDEVWNIIDSTLDGGR